MGRSAYLVSIDHGVELVHRLEQEVGQSLTLTLRKPLSDPDVLAKLMFARLLTMSQDATYVLDPYEIWLVDLQSGHERPHHPRKVPNNVARAPRFCRRIKSVRDVAMKVHDVLEPVELPRDLLRDTRKPSFAVFATQRKNEDAESRAIVLDEFRVCLMMPKDKLLSIHFSRSMGSKQSVESSRSHSRTPGSCRLNAWLNGRMDFLMVLLGLGRVYRRRTGTGRQST